MGKYFNYFNPNPEAKINKKTGEPRNWNREDCVVRAFCCALNLCWSVVFFELCHIGSKLFDMPNSPKVIERYANNRGMVKVSLPKYITLNKFASTHKDGIYIANIRSHVVCVKNGMINDTWDCGDYKMKTYYTFEKK